MGLFSFVGKAIGKIAGTALGLVPGGGLAKQALKLGGGLVGHLLAHKQPMATTGTKMSVAHSYGVPTLRAQPRPTFPGGVRTPQVLRASPVMPGGGVATSQGIMAPGGGVPPATYGGKSGGGSKRKRRSSSSRSSSRKRSGKKRGGGGRKLKFGSPAWRKKYMKKRR